MVFFVFKQSQIISRINKIISAKGGSASGGNNKYMKKYFTSMNRKIVMFMVLGFAFVFTTTTAFAALTLNSTTVSSDGALTLTGTASSIWDLGASNTLSLQTTNNGAITTGSGLFTLGGSLVASIIRPLSDS